jgi:hypothetical protein
MSLERFFISGDDKPAREFGVPSESPPPPVLSWSEVDFGKKWRGKGFTLPQIVLKDPDWVFHIAEKDRFPDRLRRDFQTVVRRASKIRLPPKLAHTHCVQYLIWRDGTLSSVRLIPSDTPQDGWWGNEIRLSYLHLGAAHCLRPYDKGGSRRILAKFKHHWFEDRSFTKPRAETFFANPANFVNP